MNVTYVCLEKISWFNVSSVQKATAQLTSPSS